MLKKSRAFLFSERLALSLSLDPIFLKKKHLARCSGIGKNLPSRCGSEGEKPPKKNIAPMREPNALYGTEPETSNTASIELQVKRFAMYHPGPIYKGRFQNY